MREIRQLKQEIGELKASNDAHRVGAAAATDMLNRGEKLAVELTAQVKELQARCLRLAQENEALRRGR